MGSGSVRLVFCGTPQFAVPSLTAVLEAGHEVALVLTQPDRAAGRGLEVQASPVKRLAQDRGLEIVQPEKLRKNEELQRKLKEIAPDAIVVVAYGRIIPPWMLQLPRHGNINVHGSLLPKYRGAAPVQWAVANGERETGVTTMRLDEGLDTGDTLLFRRISVGDDDTSAQLFPLLAEAGAKLLVETLGGLEAGTLHGQKQDEAAATLAPILTRDDGRLDLARAAGQTYDRWRGFSPWPGCWTMFRGKRFLLHQIHPVEMDLPDAIDPGRLWLHHEASGAARLMLDCAQNTLLELSEVQLEGKARMSGAAFWSGFQLKAGERVG